VRHGRQAGAGAAVPRRQGRQMEGNKQGRRAGTVAAQYYGRGSKGNQAGARQRNGMEAVLQAGAVAAQARGNRR